MTNLFDRPMPGHVLVALLVAILLVLALRLADEHEQKPRNHLIILGGALFAFGAVYRMAEVMAHIEQPRWSSVAGAMGVFAFLAADQRVASRYRLLWSRISSREYDGPERRKCPRLGTDPDEDFPRDGRT